MKEINDWAGKVHQGDALEVLSEVPSNSVHLIITSPPYWNIKDYENNSQMGYRDSLEEYISKMVQVFEECYRVLKPGCRLIVNIGDVYDSSDDTPYQIIPVNSLFKNQMFKETEFIDLGNIIWQKISNTDSSGGASVLGSYGRPRNGYVNYDYEYINIYKKEGKTPIPDEHDDDIDSEDWTNWFTGHWSFSGEKGVEHPAPYPIELPKRLIQMFSFSDEVVLDPFIGSGTTAIAAEQLDREWVGVDLNKEYIDMCYQRIEGNTKKIFDERSLFDY